MKLSDFSETHTTISEWPEAWLMPKEEVQTKEDLKLPNKMVPNVPVSVSDLRDLGISYLRVGSGAFASPTEIDSETGSLIKSKLGSQLRSSYANIVTLSSDDFPEYAAKDMETVFEGSGLYRRDEMSYVLVGSGFLDVRCSADRWVRLQVKKGDMITVPQDLYHRFTAGVGEKKDFVKYFAGQPFLTPLVRVMLDGRLASN